MKKPRKLIVAGVLAAALAAGGAGVAMASDGGGDTGAGDGRTTEFHSVEPRQDDGPEESGLSDVTEDDGRPSLTEDGTPPSDGGEPDVHSYPAR